MVFFPEGAFGPTNNCVGIADFLRRRGARVVFVVEESFAGTLEAKGFEERLMRLAPPPEVEEAPGQFWKDFIRDTAPVFRTSSREQLAEFMQPTWQALMDGARYVEPRLREILEEVEPDVIVEDNVVCFPRRDHPRSPMGEDRVLQSARAQGPRAASPYSGLGMDEREAWEDFRAEYQRTHADTQAEFSDWCREQGTDPLPELDFIHESPHLNLYVYPEEADYPRSAPSPPPSTGSTRPCAPRTSSSCQRSSRKERAR